MHEKHDRRKFLRLTTGAGSTLALGGVAHAAIAGDGKSDEETGALSFFEAVRTRRSVRKFTSDPVPEEHLRAILDAARLSPSSGNQQPWKFVVVRERETLDEIQEMCIEMSLALRQQGGVTLSDEVVAGVKQYYADYLSAPVYVVVLTDNQSRWPSYNEKDGALAAGYLVLAARVLGYGTVFATDSIPVPVTKKVLHIPDRYTRVCVTPIGVPVAWPESPPKKELDEFLVEGGF